MGFVSSCKVTPEELIGMKCKALSSVKIEKKNVFILLSTEFVQRELNLNALLYTCNIYDLNTAF